MTTPYLTWFDENTAKAVQARFAIWSFMGTVFGFIISSASVVAAISRPVCWFLFPLLLVVSFVGVLSILRCFRLTWRHYIELPEKKQKYDQSNPQEREEEYRRLAFTPHPVDIWESAAFWLLGIASMLFLILVVSGAVGQWDAIKSKLTT